jgi:uncharacterized protein YkwD
VTDPGGSAGSAVPAGRAPWWPWALLVLGLLLAVAAVVVAVVRPDAPEAGTEGVVGTVTSLPTPARTPEGWDVTQVDLAAYAQGLLDGTNDARRADGLDPLSASECAHRGAAARAGDLVGQEALEHAPLGPVLVACAPASTAAENLSRAAAEPPAVVEAWLGSPGHRANVLDPALDELGVACVADGDQVLCSAVFLGP